MTSSCASTGPRRFLSLYQAEADRLEDAWYEKARAVGEALLERQERAEVLARRSLAKPRERSRT